MVKLPKDLQHVINHFCKLPGVGSKTATRQALQLSNWASSELESFGRSLMELAHLKKCQECGIFSDLVVCEICTSPVRSESGTICVVETISDFMAIENSGQFHGLFHVLGGTLNPLLGIGPDELNIENLIKRMNERNIQELVLAINPSVEGDATCSYIKGLLPNGVRVERIGFGMPMGGCLEHLDPLTIAKALENRTSL